LILVDANLLIYAHVRSMPQHAAARSWLDARFNGTSRVGLPWQSLVVFMRIITNPRVFSKVVSVKDAWRQVQAWLDAPTAWIPLPDERHREILGAMLMSASVSKGGNLIPDAHLAALAVEHGLLLCTTDGDFARFPGLRWENPLLQAG
jgi:hypothetical protein